jgi:hypothetical protein
MLPASDHRYCDISLRYRYSRIEIEFIALEETILFPITRCAIDRFGEREHV